MYLMNAPNLNLATYVAFDDLQLGMHAQHVVARIVRMWEVHTEIRTVTDRHVFLGHSLLLLDEKIAKEKFRVHNHAHLVGLANTNLALPAVNPTILDALHAGTLFLDGTIYTRFFFNQHIAPISKFTNWINQTFTIIDVAANTPKMETTCIAKLCEFTSKRVQHDAYFLCQATVVDVLSTYGWNNMTCTTCLGTLEPHQNSLLCSNCQDTNVYKNDRFHVALAVLDGSDIATFIVSSYDLMHLICRISYEKLHTKVNETIFPDLSTYMDDLIGNHFLFEIKITAFNFSEVNRSFTVARIPNFPGHAQYFIAIATYDQSKPLPKLYRVELDVHDGEHGATFVILEKEMRKLTNKTATTFMEEKGNKGNNNILPTCLSDLAGKHFCFQIRVSPLNYTPKNQNFMVSNISYKDFDEGWSTFEELNPNKKPTTTSTIS
ncbi:predicted protein [Arabidopsis lyrata subsp. lyrata]|uniref:Predicted protein n=1 Tax=Arabidopsis lyrata subsp. lyrata TaxID=81972 RepID=D7MPH3_ARALL|nr:predicted protein [Arabidopsis lyrata subsp. lyrata]